MSERTAGSKAAGGRRLAWTVDAGRRVLTIECRGAVTDDDLLSLIPPIWGACPEVIGYDTLVDARAVTSEGGWSWAVLREVGRLWRDFAQGRDLGRRTAIVTTDSWIAMLAGAFVLDYQGRHFRCFADPGAARIWLAGR